MTPVIPNDLISPSAGGLVSAPPSMHGPASTAFWPDFLVGQADQPVKVMLVDDDPHIRHVIVQELLADSRIHLVAQAEG